MDPVKILWVMFSVWLGGWDASARWLPDDDNNWLKIRTRILYPNNFASVRINSHGERELRISFGKVLAMETFIASGYSSDYDMAFRQITDGRRILQAVYQGGVMKECDYSKDSSQMLDFISSFMAPDYHGEEYGDILSVVSYANYTSKSALLAYRSFKNLEYLKQMSVLVDMHFLRAKCKKFQKTATTVAEEEAKSGNFTDIYAEILLNTDPEKLSDSNKELLRNIEARNASVAEHSISKRSTDPVKRRRSKRAAFDFSSVLIFPGTKWCGKGDLAQCYEDLGDDKELDACCRDHDCCPFVIPPFSSKFGIFNYRFHSLLHCDCDQRFRGCLRESPSSMANMIGKIYFNILGSKCFDFTELEVCAERSWWGRCQRYEKQTIAEVKSQVSFLDKNGQEDYAVVEN